MALYLSPIANDQQMDANGDPLVGGKIYTYLAGSTTPAATYTDSTGGTAQANPIILNGLGLSASPIWLTGGVSYKFVIKDSADVTLRTIDGISGINDVSSTAQEWNESGFVPTYISATQFSVPGDQTALLQVNRRLRCDVTAGFAYGRISVSAFAAGITTVTVVNDGTPLDSGLSSIAYGFLSFSPSSVPYALYAAAGANNDVTSLLALSVGGVPNGVITPAKLSQPATLGASVATTSGTSIDFTSIPTWVNRVVVPLAGVSTNGADHILFQLGSSGIKTSGYLSTAMNLAAGPSLTTGTFTAGFGVLMGGAAAVIHGEVVFQRVGSGSNTWEFTQNISRSDGAICNFGGGSATLTGALDTIRLTTVGGVNTFDAGSAAIYWG